MPEPIAIISAKRTPIGGLMGSLSSVSAPKLGAIAINAARESAGLKISQIDEIIMGCVLSAGVGQAPARQAGFKAGMDKGLEATTINKMCGSGLQAAVMGRQSIAAGDANIVIVGGPDGRLVCLRGLGRSSGLFKN